LILIYRCLDRNPRLLETLTINISHCTVCVKLHSQAKKKERKKERKKETFRKQRTTLAIYQQELNAMPREFDSLTKLVDENEQRLQSIQQELNAKQREFDCLSLTGLIKERHYEVDEKEKRLREKVENQVKDLESKEIFYQVRANLCKYLMSMTLIHLNQLNDAIIWKKY